MDDEFEKIMGFFSLETAEKEARLEEIFQNSIEFFDHFKHVQAGGNKEEIQHMKGKLEKMYQKVREEATKASERSGLSHEQIKELASNPINFNPKQWEFLQTARAKLEQQNQEMSTKLKKGKAERKEGLSQSKKTHKTKKKDWLKS